MRITAAVLETAGGPFALRDVDLGEPRPDEVLVGLSGTGICGTDLEFATFFPTPAVLGHEGSGVVERVGAQVTSVAPGDRVAMSFTSCGRCPTCRTGAPAYCHRFDAVNFSGRRPDGSSALSLDGAPINGHFLGQSSFATHAVVPERAIVPIGDGIDVSLAGPFGCGFQTGAGGVFNVLRPEAGSSIAVFGAGAVGVAAIIAAAVSGCGIVAAVDVNAAKLEAARSYGATHIVDSTATGAGVGTATGTGAGAGAGTAEALRAIAPHGFDYVIDTTGRQDVLRTAVEALGPLGRCGVIGVGPSPEMSFDWRSVLNGRTITGIIAGSSVPQVFLPKLLDLHAAGRFPVDRMMTAFPFEKINEAVAAVRAGEVAKAVLTF
ncbi:NAD(P)-dependent alcohol dehydrogenase [Microtetraspora sp. NBRC 16547]|uniref:NAD(P)-dependent alcohol dehydrogenase n=1 Tax=Microtetraspora sp. NBRC 16547 TaxID=3030993 RepID=UPI00249FC56B|nr:NAD(P)-dependent alcohol dehydrogenase [Microtetraspora sp. NBRC 16547]GLW97134.1 alcohol dehydrogenase [Microtetraspora sp. NBRC 16547]